jgi:hypothetical protein
MNTDVTEARRPKSRRCYDTNETSEHDLSVSNPSLKRFPLALVVHKIAGS